MKPAERALFEAIANGKADVVAQMIRADKELLSAVDDESNPPRKGDNPVHLAARLNQLAVLNVILEASIDEKNRKRSDNGVTPILLATAKQHVDVVKRLLKAEVDLTAVNRNDKNFTAIFYAIATGNIQIVQALVDAGADIFYKAENGQCAIDLANNLAKREVIDILIKAMEAKKNELEAQKLEAEKKRGALAARNDNLRAEIATAQAQYTQDQNKLNSEFAQYSLDVYKSTVVDGNKGPLPKFVPSSVASSKTNQAYADAQQKQAAPSGQPPALATTPAKKPN